MNTLTTTIDAPPSPTVQAYDAGYNAGYAAGIAARPKLKPKPKRRPIRSDPVAWLLKQQFAVGITDKRAIPRKGRDAEWPVHLVHDGNVIEDVKVASRYLRTITA